MLIPEALHASGFGVIETVSMRHQRFTYVRLSHSHMPCLVHDFSMSFTTAAFGRSSTWLFGASTYMVDSEGPSFIFRTT
jgi:hypothetical protein